MILTCLRLRSASLMLLNTAFTDSVAAALVVLADLATELMMSCLFTKYLTYQLNKGYVNDLKTANMGWQDFF